MAKSPYYIERESPGGDTYRDSRGYTSKAKAVTAGRNLATRVAPRWTVRVWDAGRSRVVWDKKAKKR